MKWLNNILGQINGLISHIDEKVLSYVTMAIRFILPVLAVIIVTRCLRSLLREKSEAEQWGFLRLPNGARIYLNHWENVIGRAKSSDVYMEYPTLSRTHAAVIRDGKGNWRIHDIRPFAQPAHGGWFRGKSAGPKEAITVNGEPVEGRDGALIITGDTINLSGVELVFVSIDRAGEYEQASQRTRPGRIVKQVTTLTFVTEFQLLLGIQLCISMGESFTAAVPLCWITLIAVMWLSYLITRALKRVAFEVETIAFFLSTIGMAVTVSVAPWDIVKQTMLVVAGVCLFFAVGWFLRDLTRAKRMRLPIAVAGVLLLASNIIFSREIYGARGWLEIGGVSFQPSEFVKIALIFAGAATLDRLFAKRNLVIFIGFSGVCVVALAVINDFGSALVFFVTYLVIAFLRSGDFTTIFLSVGGAGFAGFLAMRFRTHIAARFSTWGRAWEFAYSGGFQQTRAMSAAASGGLFGVGAGYGWFKNVFAAGNDLVFGLVSEELGLIVAAVTVCAVLVLAVFSVRAAGAARSSFYVIGACAAASILVFQMSLNVLGSVDILPFTGITFPFVSRGGSSLIASWGLLAFIKAADTRQNASFVIKTPKAPHGYRKKPVSENEIPEGLEDIDEDAM